MASAVVLVSLFVWGTSRLGCWLIVEDRAELSDVIVVLTGDMPFRAIEAARIYQRGLAPEVWLTHDMRPAEQDAFRKLGIAYIPEDTYNREVLERMFVPAQSIHVLQGPARNTADEVLLIARELRRLGRNKVILVTSKPHSRRVKATWRALVGDVPQAQVHCATEAPYDPTRWWKNTEDALAVSRELLGLFNVWAGFPVRPDRK